MDTTTEQAARVRAGRGGGRSNEQELRSNMAGNAQFNRLPSESNNIKWNKMEKNGEKTQRKSRVQVEEKEQEKRVEKESKTLRRVKQDQSKRQS